MHCIVLLQLIDLHVSCCRLEITENVFFYLLPLILPSVIAYMINK